MPWVFSIIESGKVHNNNRLQSIFLKNGSPKGMPLFFGVHFLSYNAFWTRNTETQKRDRTYDCNYYGDSGKDGYKNILLPLSSTCN